MVLNNNSLGGENEFSRTGLFGHPGSRAGNLFGQRYAISCGGFRYQSCPECRCDEHVGIDPLEFEHEYEPTAFRSQNSPAVWSAR